MNVSGLALALVAVAVVLVGRRVMGAVASPPMDRNAVFALIVMVNRVSFADRLDPYDVLAIVEIESSFRPDAFRDEPHINDASRGLMQILLSTARDRGFTGEPDELLNPELNIRYGMAQMIWTYDYLASRLGYKPTEDEWIGAYNAGVGNVMRGYIPDAYVSKWRVARSQYPAR